MIVLGVLLAVYVMLAALIPSGWLVPDLAIVGLVLSIARQPARWLPLSAVAAVFMSLWVVRFAGPVLLGYVAFGWTVHALARRLDVTDLRLQVLTAGLGAGMVALGALWVEGLWSVSFLGLAGVRAIVTGLAVVLVRRLLSGRDPGLRAPG